MESKSVPPGLHSDCTIYLKHGFLAGSQILLDTKPLFDLPIELTKRKFDRYDTLIQIVLNTCVT